MITENKVIHRLGEDAGGRAMRHRQLRKAAQKYGPGSVLVVAFVVLVVDEAL
jgi:hypothetical protein